MDEVLFFSRIFPLLTQGRPLGDRLTDVLDAVREMLALEAASIHLVSDDVDEDFCYGSASDDAPAVDCSIFCKLENDWAAVDEVSARHVYQQHYGCLTGEDPREIFEIRFAVGGSVTAALQVMRRGGQRPFEGLELISLRLLATYLRVAIYQSLWGLPQGALVNSTERILARFHIGLLTIDGACEVLARSALAEKLLQECNCLAIRGQKLEARSPAARKSLPQILHELDASDSGVYRFLSCDSTDAAAIVAIARSNDRGIESQLRGAQYSVFIFSPEQEAIDIDSAADIWRISVAERRILLAMMRYDSAKRVASELNVSVNTVKAQLKSAYRKMGIVSKAMLVRKLYSARNIEALIDVS